MLKNLLVLPDGTEIFSGTGTVNAVCSVKLTQRVNDGPELTLGSVCAGVLEVTLFTPGGALEIPISTELTLYKVDDAGIRTRVGLFTVEKATRLSANRYRLTAYDRVRRLDRVLEDLSPWPGTLYAFAQQVCQACELTLANESIPNGDLPVEKFAVAGFTGRQLMQWVGQASGRFCRAREDGMVELAFYAPKDVRITPDGEAYAFCDSLIWEDYQVAPIDAVHIRANTKDLGVTCGGGSNGYVITGNPLLSGGSQEQTQEAARVLYEVLRGVTYTPCRLSVLATTEIQAGDILQVTDRNGRDFSIYVMHRVQQGQKDTLECTGSPRRDSPSAMGDHSWEELQGKVLELEVSVDGLRAESRNGNGKMAELALTVEGLKTKVTQQQAGAELTLSRLSAVEQTAEGIALRVRSVYDDGVTKVNTSAGYTFDENGMTVRKSGKEIKTQITEDGMTVYKNDRAVLTANSQGVEAVDLQAATYLSIAGKSRFEKYKSNRVGCFWIGG